MGRGGTWVGIVALLGLLLGAPAHVRAAAGDIDLTFGQAGVVFVDFNLFYDSSRTVAVQPDGLLVVGGDGWVSSTAHYHFGLVRLLPDGSLDETFGNGGRVITQIAILSTISRVLVQPDGKIVAAGAAQFGNYYRFTAVRYLADGTLDPTFGTGGIVTTDIGADHDGAGDMVLQPDGKLVLFGYRVDPPVTGGSVRSWALVRYNSNGTLDPTFGNGGIVITKHGPLSDSLHAGALQTDGKIVAVGEMSPGGGAPTDVALARYLPNGSLDSSFGTGGKVVTQTPLVSELGNGVVIQPDGKIVVAGSAKINNVFHMALTRYMANGALDTSFGVGGRTTIAPGGLALAQTILLQPDGKLVVAGQSKLGASNEYCLARFLPNGTLDTTFGNAGVTYVVMSTVDDIPYDIAAQADGSIVVVGQSYTDANWYDFGITRVLAGAICGDGILQDGEQCDDGNTQNGDCCSSSCQLDGAGAPCADDGNPCTADVCNAANACEHPVGPAGVTCRAANGPCDVAETCDGISSTCPANGLAAQGTVCRGAAGPCDAADTCTGSSSACPADTFQPAGTSCRASAGVCDLAEACSGTGPACPTDAKSTATCRPARDACDVAESCTGSSNDCPADGFASAATTCRAAAGACDVAESCTGTGPACPADAVAPAGQTCRAAADVCDAAEVCDGLASACPSDGFAAAGTSCRVAAGPCDAAEACTGLSSSCPADGFAAAGTTCRPSAGVCDVAEVCAGDTAACPSDAKSTAVCRGSAGVCDVAESCNGSDDQCPADTFAPTSTVCRSASGECDVAESCSGSGPTCPADGFRPAESACADDGEPCTRDVCSGGGAACQHPAGNAGTSCRPAAGPCDGAEACDGVAPTCPTDAFLPATTQCRASAGVCDAPDLCSGTGAACPADLKLGGVCRPAAGICDASEWCDGTHDDCPADAFAPSSVTCRASGGECDVAETCTGSGASCPADAFSPADTPCSGDGEACTRDVCGGANAACQHPAGNAGTICREAAGACDAAEACNGVSPTCPADGGLADSDADGLCDAVDPCTNVGGGRTLVLTNPIPKIILNRINTDTTPGNDHLSVVGAFYLPSNKTFADLNPLALGARIVIVNRLAGTELDVNVPPGAQGGSNTRGWNLTNQGKTWTFNDPTSNPAGAITKVQLFDRSATAARRVEINIVGDNGTYPVVAGDEPIDVSLAVGGQAEAAAGLCTESDFVAADCSWNLSRNQLTCKK